MANLRFTFDGNRQPIKGRPMPFFAPRYSGQRGRLVPREYRQEEEQARQQEIEEEKEKDSLSYEESELPENKQQEDPPEEKLKEEEIYNISEVLISQLDSYEVKLNDMKGKVDLAGKFLDDAIYKLDSLLQIIDIIKANEVRRVQGAELQSTYEKNDKDTIDNILEVLQTPALQGITRQFLLGLTTRGKMS